MECRTNMPHVNVTTRNISVLKNWNTLDEVGTLEDDDIDDAWLIESGDASRKVTKKSSSSRSRGFSNGERFLGSRAWAGNIFVKQTLEWFPKVVFYDSKIINNSKSFLVVWKVRPVATKGYLTKEP